MLLPTFLGNVLKMTLYCILNGSVPL